VVAEDLASDRVLEAGEHFVVAVPFAARWPYEVHVTARRHGVGRLGDLDDAAALELTRLLAGVLERYDAMWAADLPYMLCVQEAPAAADGSGAEPDWHLHVELLPPHRTPTRLKVRASVETALAVFINDTLPESTAAELRAASAAGRDWSGVTLPRIEPMP
jgi:UDPglucose--hexose-1-phosphate uridylyltransferase